jgi:hypothetical protein
LPGARPVQRAEFLCDGELLQVLICEKSAAQPERLAALRRDADSTVRPA